MKEYDHSKIEKKWQKEWEKEKLYRVEDKVKGKENYFTLVEFTYPSGNLHVGHWYAFSVPDIFARFQRMRGYNSLYPMGFDAFGLPAENAAIKLGADPKVWTFEQMDKMRTQLRSMGAMFDWEREIVSCEPEYYKWTQWMFNKFLEHDLVYRAATKVNWCPKDQTILANEQVVDGCCERCGAPVEQRDQEQWMLRITKYADRLIDDLDKLDWPEEIKAAQRNWIGRSEGSEISFRITFSASSSLRPSPSERDPRELGIEKTNPSIKIFTTRADTIFGATYLVLAPEHPLVGELLGRIENKSEVEKYISDTKKKSELDRQQSKEKTGVELKGVKAINPANNEEIPVWIADYVLSGYGTGAIMAVPAHDERDSEFAKKYSLPVRRVVEPLFIKKGGSDGVKESLPLVERKAVVCVVEHWSENKFLCLAWKANDWKGFVVGGIEEGEDEIVAGEREAREETGYQNFDFIKKLDYKIHSQFYHEVKKQNRYAHFEVLYFKLKDGERKDLAEEENKLHDVVWIERDKVDSYVSADEDMQFIWEAFTNPKPFIGEGILVNSGKYDGMLSVEAKEKITKAVGGKMVKTYRLRDWGISRQRYWGCPIPIVYDPAGKAHPVPEEHLPWLLPSDVDHTPSGVAPFAKSKELFARTEKIFGKGWKPEVETMDTFVDSSWYFYRYLDPKNGKTFAGEEERKAWMPIDLYMGGAEHTTMHLLYSRFWVKAMHDLGLVDEDEAYVIRRNRGLILGPDGNKMSKSKGNVINPDEIVERLGADTVRLYLAFIGPYGVTVNYPWDPNGVVGVRRFLERVWRLQTKLDLQKNKCRTDSLLHKTIKGVGEDIGLFKFNTAIAKMMIFLNALEKEEKVGIHSFRNLLALLAPFAPHMTEELWRELGEKQSIHLSPWPEYDEALTHDEKVKIAVQVNSRVRAEIAVSAGESEEEVKQKAMAEPVLAKYVKGVKIKKIVYIPGRLINIVI
ncbi:MAG TPA: class I tRNA ligase family protein [Candidatus Paceibacterota bacterium]|nr:class I tRNA ligase family protein [Candidatus Paceibacterota bacterium]